MSVLVLGAGGMAGHAIVLRLAELGHDLTGLARRELSLCKTIVADVRDIEKSVNLNDYDTVINCVGMLVKACEDNPSEAVWINSYLPRLLVKLTKDSKTKIVHLSTDCVFAGLENGGYAEQSPPDTVCLYGRSKALGELNDDKNLTLRMSIVGPDINKNGVGLFNWFMRQNSTVGGYMNVVWTGVTTLELANAIHAALAQNLTGMYHLVNNDTISKFELLKLFNSLRGSPIEITANDTVSENKSLVNTRTDFDFAVPSYADMVNEMGDWIRRNKAIYPLYDVRL